MKTHTSSICKRRFRMGNQNWQKDFPHLLRKGLHVLKAIGHPQRAPLIISKDYSGFSGEGPASQLDVNHGGIKTVDVFPEEELFAKAQSDEKSTGKKGDPVVPVQPGNADQGEAQGDADQQPESR
jgi:hypothetical protein